jgi:hypothetical protein
MAVAVNDLVIEQQQGYGRGGERLGDRADQELRRGGDRQVSLNISLTIALQERHFASSTMAMAAPGTCQSAMVSMARRSSSVASSAIGWGGASGE